MKTPFKHLSALRKTLILIAASISFPISLISQSEAGCGQAIVTETWLQLHPEYRSAYEQFKREPSELPGVDGTEAARITAANYTIPVVFHILHMGGPENISDAQVRDAVAILNRDYQKKNADTINVVAPFANNIAKVNFAFELATIDPNGNCTNGIIRHLTPKTAWNANDLSWFTYSWPRNKYLNIYIVKSLNIAATAYSFLPPVNVPPNADAIVCMHSCCGTVGTGNPANSRTLTHEVAHWFNIPHIWGSSNQPGVACGDDGIGDTPVTKGFITCNPATSNVCNPAIFENVQNYMDYSPCKIMFTNGQSAVMNSVITSTLCERNSIWTNANLIATGIITPGTGCIPLVEIEASPGQTLCLGSPLTLRSYTHNAEATSYSWSATNGALLASPNSSSTSFVLNSPGSSTVTCVVSNSNGATSASMIVTIKNGAPQITGMSTESFEGPVLPLNWSVLNPNTPAATWSLASSAASDGSRSIYVNGEDAPAGSVEILESPSYDFLSNPGSLFTFKCAYARKSVSHKDIFKVQASKDCGGSWTDVLMPGAFFLSSGSGEVDNNLFIPTADQWKSYNVTQAPQFVPFLDQPNVRLRFYFKEDTVTGFGNRLYLDQVNFETPNTLNNYSQRITLKVFPNPATNMLAVDFTLSDLRHLKIYLSSVSGGVLKVIPEKTYDPGKHCAYINGLDQLAAGIYFLNMEFDGIKVTRKVMIEG